MTGLRRQQSLISHGERISTAISEGARIAAKDKPKNQIETDLCRRGFFWLSHKDRCNDMGYAFAETIKWQISDTEFGPVL